MMDKEKAFKWLWGCVSIIFIVMYLSSAFLETVKIYKLSNGSTISLELGGIAELALVVAAYFISKIILRSDS